MNFSRIARHLWQEVIHCPEPHGLLHWRYLLPGRHRGSQWELLVDRILADIT